MPTEKANTFAFSHKIIGYIVLVFNSFLFLDLGKLFSHNKSHCCLRENVDADEFVYAIAQKIAVASEKDVILLLLEKM